MINSNITKSRRARAMRLTKGKCWFCGEDATTVDHAEPLAWGGKNASWNLLPACARCNGRKQDSTVEEFREWLKLFYELPSRQQPSDALYQHFLVGRFYGEILGVWPTPPVEHKQNLAGPLPVSRYSIADKLKAALENS